MLLKTLVLYAVRSHCSNLEIMGYLIFARLLINK